MKIPFIRINYSVMNSMKALKFFPVFQAFPIKKVLSDFCNGLSVVLGRRPDKVRNFEKRLGSPGMEVKFRALFFFS